MPPPPFGLSYMAEMLDLTIKDRKFDKLYHLLSFIKGFNARDSSLTTDQKFDETYELLSVFRRYDTSDSSLLNILG